MAADHLAVIEARAKSANGKQLRILIVPEEICQSPDQTAGNLLWPPLICA
jgi:hypothetical protein